MPVPVRHVTLNWDLTPLPPHSLSKQQAEWPAFLSHGRRQTQADGEKKNISIVVKDQAGNEVQFKVKTITKFTKVMEVSLGGWCSLLMLALLGPSQATWNSFRPPVC